MNKTTHLPGLIILTGLIVLAISGCSSNPTGTKHQKGGGSSGGGDHKPSITSIKPAKGTVGTKVTISGNNFSPTASEDIVKFGSVQAKVTHAFKTALQVIVPNGLNPGKQVSISVTVDGQTAVASHKFKVTEPAPSISKIAPRQGVVGDTVTITGHNFVESASKITVKFGNKRAQVIDASPTKLKAIVPKGFEKLAYVEGSGPAQSIFKIYKITTKMKKGVF